MGRDETKEITKGNNGPEDPENPPGRRFASTLPGRTGGRSVSRVRIVTFHVEGITCMLFTYGSQPMCIRTRAHTHSLLALFICVSFFNSRCSLCLKGIVWGAPQNRSWWISFVDACAGPPEHSLLSSPSSKAVLAPYLRKPAIPPNIGFKDADVCK